MSDTRNSGNQLLSTIVLSLLLAACGGDSSAPSVPAASGNATASSAGPQLPVPTAQNAARLLAQATYGATQADIDEVMALCWNGWIEKQFVTPSIESHRAYVARRGPPGCNPCDANEYINLVMESFWRQAVLGPDQLRQRTAFALLQIFVIGQEVEMVPTAYSEYQDMLSRNAFGNFRTLLEEVSLHPTMGRYLSHIGNDKEDPTPGGRIPDQNYAREVMQLFSIGLWQLNPDGSRKKDSAGKDIPTYGAAEVVGMSRVFTGWNWGDNLTRDDLPRTPNTWEYGYRNVHDVPMKAYPDHHSSSPKQIINGVTIPANTGPRESLKIALDALFNHPNVGPFIGSQLIKRLVTSNPSPAYVTRVTNAFNDNGAGVRGDMKAVLRAVLLDPEARDMTKVTQADWGKLREPLLRYGQFLRTFKVGSDTGRYRIWNLESVATSIGQNPYRAPSVFNWYRPDFSPAGPIFRAGLVAPEFQMTHETTIAGYTNFIVNKAERETEVFYPAPRSDRDMLFTQYVRERELADRPDALLDHLDLMLMSGQMRPALRSRIVTALNSIPLRSAAADNLRDRYKRVSTAVALVMASPQDLIQK